MPKNGAKATKKFARSGGLKQAIDSRRKHQKLKKQIQARKSVRGAPVQRGRDNASEGESDGEEQNGPVPVSKGKVDKKAKGRAKAVDFLDPESDADGDAAEVAPVSSKGKFSGMSVDDLLSGKFMDDEDEEGGEDAEDKDEDDNFSSIDDLEDEEEAHKLELAALAEKDPVFFKYLQENDKELLNFSVPNISTGGGDSDDEDGGFDLDGQEDDEDEDMEAEEETPVLTAEILKGWQKALLQTRSLRALRKLLVAFRSAARMNEEDQQPGGWKIEEANVFNKLVVTAFKYTPVVLEHHIPYKTLPNGKFKMPTQTSKFKTLQKLILSYFLNIVRFVSELSSEAGASMQQLAVSESSKLIPYIVNSRKAIRSYLKMCFDLWSSAADEVRIAALLAMRKLVSSQDESIVDLVLRGSYLTLLRSCKATSSHTLPSITLMKNSAAELYFFDQPAAYQHAFGFIRQLAIHLRNSMKVKSKEAYKQVYNWQFVHTVDFWSMTLAKACDHTLISRGGEESELKPLIYPLIQVTIGAIQLIPTARYYPLHLHLIRSLLHLTQRTKTYLNLAPFLLTILTSSLSPSSSSTRPKNTLRALDLALHIRAPSQYLRTRAYTESVVEEALFLYGSWAESVQPSIAFPEIVLPGVIALRKALKKASHSPSNGQGKGKGRSSGNHRLNQQIKALLERIEEGSKWVSSRRDKVSFAPGMTTHVERWESDTQSKLDETPIGKWMRIQRKVKEKKLATLEKAKQGEHELLDDDEENDE